MLTKMPSLKDKILGSRLKSEKREEKKVKKVVVKKIKKVRKNK